LNLFIDIGNTRTKWALASDKQVKQRGSVFNHTLDSLVFPVKGVISVLACSVASDAMTEKVAELVNQQTGLLMSLTKVTRSAAGLTNNYQALDQLGIDRWVAAIGAHTKSGSVDAVVVDAGTAVTIDWVSREGAFEGGVILPGLNLMHDSLVGRTAGVKSQLAKITSVVGRSTEECVNSGAFYGLLGAIERVVNELMNAREHADGPYKVFVCGGDAQRLLAYLPDTFELAGDLIFEGLRELAGSGQVHEVEIQKK